MPKEEITADAVELDRNSLDGDGIPAGPPSGLTCPDCGGALWESRQDRFRRYQCHVGHAFVAEGLLESQAEEIERQLWSLLRILKERMTLARQLAEQGRQHNSSATVVWQFDAQAGRALQRAELIRQLLLLGELSPPSEPSTVSQTWEEQQDL